MDINKTPINVLSPEAYIIYLRKSRADNPNESIEEVLARHEAELQEYAEKHLGGRIPEENIFREVVSGETIDEREAVQSALAMIENPAIKGCLVVEPARLSRGDLTDCGRIVSSFRYTNTLVVTPRMTYDLTNKMERKFFEQELMRGNDFLEYTKEILYAGRIRSVKAGAYIGNIAPYGYDKCMISDHPSLTPNDDADTVRLAFDLFVNQGYTLLEIAKQLDALGAKPMRGDHWEKCSVKNMLINEHYKGYVRFGRKKTVKVVIDGQVVKKRDVPADAEEIVIAKGLHDALVSEEMWDKAQEILAERARTMSRSKADAPLKNTLAGLFWCKKCGRAMKQHPYKKARDRFECSNRRICQTKSVPIDEVLDAVAFILENEKLPELEVKLKNDDGKSAVIQKKQLEKLNKQLEELKAQQERQYEFLEKGTYTEEIFIKRNAKVVADIEEVKTKIFQTKKDMPKEINYTESILRLNRAIEALRGDTLTPEEKNKLLKAIIGRIEYELIGYEGKGKTIYKLHVFLLV